MLHEVRQASPLAIMLIPVYCPDERKELVAGKGIICQRGRLTYLIQEIKVLRKICNGVVNADRKD